MERFLIRIARCFFVLCLFAAVCGIHSHHTIEQEQRERAYIRSMLQEEMFVRELLTAARQGDLTEEELRARAGEVLPGTEQASYEDRFDGLFLVTNTGFMRLEGFLATEGAVSECPYPEIRLTVADSGDEIFVYRMEWGWD